MDSDLLNAIKRIIVNSTGAEIDIQKLSDDLPLVGNILDSMSITNLILNLEEYFGFTFVDEELIAESFENIVTLAELINKKITS